MRNYGKTEKMRKLIEKIGKENVLIIDKDTKLNNELGRALTPEESRTLQMIQKEVEELGVEKFKEKYSI